MSSMEPHVGTRQSMRTPGLPGDVLDPLAAEDEILLRSRYQVRRSDAHTVFADVGEDVLRLLVELLVVDLRDRVDAAGRREVGRDVLDPLAQVVDVAAVSQR
jgi:hypothetical protein